MLFSDASVQARSRLSESEIGMRWLIHINIVAIVVYASFAAAIVVADIWIFPELDSSAVNRLSPS